MAGKAEMGEIGYAHKGDVCGPVVESFAVPSLGALVHAEFRTHILAQMQCADTRWTIIVAIAELTETSASGGAIARRQIFRRRKVRRLGQIAFEIDRL
jgi:hypothetical protein